MLPRTLNIRGHPEKDLRLKADELYREIEAGYKMIKKTSDKEEAKKIIDQIWVKRACANNIQLELIRREYTENEA